MKMRRRKPSCPSFIVTFPLLCSSQTQLLIQPFLVDQEASAPGLRSRQPAPTAAVALHHPVVYRAESVPACRNTRIDGPSHSDRKSPCPMISANSNTGCTEDFDVVELGHGGERLLTTVRRDAVTAGPCGDTTTCSTPCGRTPTVYRGKSPK